MTIKFKTDEELKAQFEKADNFYKKIRNYLLANKIGNTDNNNNNNNNNTEETDKLLSFEYHDRIHDEKD